MFGWRGRIGGRKKMTPAITQVMMLTVGIQISKLPSGGGNVDPWIWVRAWRRLGLIAHLIGSWWTDLVLWT